MVDSSEESRLRPRKISGLGALPIPVSLPSLWKAGTRDSSPASEQCSGETQPDASPPLLGTNAESSSEEEFKWADDSMGADGFPRAPSRVAASSPHPVSSVAFPPAVKQNRSPPESEAPSSSGSEAAGPSTLAPRSGSRVTPSRSAALYASSSTAPRSSVPAREAQAPESADMRPRTHGPPSASTSRTARGHKRTSSAPIRDSANRSPTLDGVYYDDDLTYHRTHRVPHTIQEAEVSHYRRSSEADGAAAQSIQGSRSTAPSLGARSVTTLRHFASVWVPGASRLSSPSDTPKGGSSPVLRSSKGLQPIGPDEEKQLALGPPRPQRRRAVRLDRRRLDKAVTLAVEAAQVAEEDEVVRQQRQRRRKVRAEAEAAFRALPESHTDDLPRDGLLSRIRTISDISSLTDVYTRPRFSSLSWSGKAPRCPREEQPTHDAGLEVTDIGFSSSEDSGLSRFNSDDSEEEVDNFSLSLYLSALSYLLSALPAHETPHLPPKEREELRSKLESVLQDMGYDDRPTAGGALRSSAGGNTGISDSEAQREERLREMLETELRRAEARMLGGAMGSSVNNVRPTIGRQTSRPIAASDEAPRRSGPGGTLAATIAYSTLELTFAVAAAGVGVLGSGLAMLAPAATQTSDDAAPKVAGAIEPPPPRNEKGTVSAQLPFEALRPGAVQQPPSSGAAAVKHDVLSAVDSSSARNLQWNLAMALASTTATTLYGCLSAAAAETASEERRLGQLRGPGGGGKGGLQPGTSTALVPSEKSLAAQSQLDGEAGIEETAMAEDRLILLTASFARALRRSPLPSQVSSLTSQLKSLLQAIDEKYAVRRRAADEALRRTRQGLGYVRKKGWHVTIVRGLWAMMEMGVAGIEAWREEGAGQVEAARWADQEGPHSPMVITASA